MSGQSIKWDIVWTDKSVSTNAELKSMAKAGALEGKVLVADCQSCGRGRLGRSWISDGPWGLWTSVLLKPSMKHEDVPFLGMIMALAAARSIKNLTNLNAGIKWPNDVEANGYKLAGILPEAGFGPSGLEWVVIGLGMNLAPPSTPFPDEVSRSASNLLDLSGIGIPRENMLIAVLEEFGLLYNTYENIGAAPLLSEIRALSTIEGRRIAVRNASSDFEADVLGIDDSGCLMVKKDEGSTIRLLSGEVSVRRL